MSEITKRVGIMGGTFNPIHIGHLIVAEAAYEAYNLDEVLFVPSGHSYMKEQSEILDAKTRVHMTGLSIEDNPHFALSTIEIDRDGNSYSYETLEALRKENPTTEYYFIVGADTLFDLERWQHPEILLPSCTILVAVRNGIPTEEMQKQADYLEKKFGGSIKLLPTSNIEISATDIRNRLAQNRDIRYLVKETVYQYIHKNDLYIKKEDTNKDK